MYGRALRAAPRTASRMASRFGRSNSAPASTAVNGLTFASNNVASSDVRLVWDSTVLLSRNTHTAFWKASYIQQSGYYAVAWHTQLTGSFAANAYEFGTHPYPSAAGVKDGNGDVQDGSSSTGTVHYFEETVPAGTDKISSPGGSSYLVTKGQWYSQARRCYQPSSNFEHSYFVDIAVDPSKKIVQNLASTGSAGSTPAFYFGASDWTASGGANSETPSCTLRGIILFNTGLSDAHVAAIAALDTDAAVLSYCSANSLTSNLWYLNMNPTPTDVTDKSGNGRNPRWHNSNRPTLYTG